MQMENGQSVLEDRFPQLFQTDSVTSSTLKKSTILYILRIGPGEQSVFNSVIYSCAIMAMIFGVDFVRANIDYLGLYPLYWLARVRSSPL